MNRNYEEELDVPVGPDNTIDPGSDRGQPTHFLTRRHKNIFAVVVPKDFGDRTLVWTLTAHGKTESVPGSLNPVFQIDRQRTTRGGNSENINSNVPPVVTVQPADQAITRPASATLTLSATDDGLPQRRGKPVGMTAEWAKYRGPGVVTFKSPQQMVENGKATTTASFSEPGTYVIQVVVDDGARGNFGYNCCWTNAELRVTVK